MNDDDLDALVASTARFSDATAAALPLAGADAELLEAIMSTPHLTGGRPAAFPLPPIDPGADEQFDGPMVMPAPPAGPRRRSPRTVARMVTLAGAAVLVVGGVAVGLAGGGDEPATVAPAAAPGTIELVQLLPDQPGWEAVTYFNDDSQSGNLRLVNGPKTLNLAWYPESHYDEYVAEREHRMTSETSVAVPGGQARVLGQGIPGPGQTDLYFTSLWLYNGELVEFRGDGFASQADFSATVASLQEVDDATWQAAVSAAS
jgi:hypothetical protein